MPASEKDVVCPRRRNVLREVASGVITVSASGALREALEDGDSGIDLRLALVWRTLPVRCRSWDCVTGTTIERRHRPAICR
jgi:hypothetical protein